MEEEYLRKVQLTGRTTLSVSLPKEWATKIGIKPGTTIKLIPRYGLTLLLIPEKMEEKKREASLLIDEETRPDEAARELISLYLAGFDIIRIKLITPRLEAKAYIKNVMRRRLMGMEILSESATDLLTQCFAQHMELPLGDALNRAGEIALSMKRDAVKALLKRDLKLAAEVVQRDDEVDRLFHFIMRQLNLAAETPKMMEELGLRSVMDCLSYASVAKAVERIGDHASSIAKVTQMMTEKPSGKTGSGITAMAEKVGEIFSCSLKSFSHRDKKSANKVVKAVNEVRREYERMVENVMKWKANTRNASLLKTALEDLMRVAEYSVDIAEQAIFLSLT